MKRGERPSATIAILWSFMAGVFVTNGINHADPVNLALALAYAVLGPIAWFVGRS